MTLWHVNRVEPGKEIRVALALGLLDIDIYVPTEVRSRRPTLKSRRHLAFKALLCPRMVFAAIPSPVDGKLAGLRYSRGLAMSPAAVAWQFEAWEVEQFKVAVDEWNTTERKRIEAGSRGRPTKRKWGRLADLGEMLAQNVENLK